MEALARIGVLEEVGAVEEGEAVVVHREVGGDPVEDDADPFLVQVVDEEHQILRRAEAAGGGEVAERLVAPGAVVRVLHDGEQLDVGEAQLLDVLGEEGGGLAVGEETVVFFRIPLVQDSPPGAEVDLVDGDGGREVLLLLPGQHPVRVPPRVVEVPDDRGARRRHLGVEGEGIGLVGPVAAVAGDDVELVAHAGGDVRHEGLPDPGGAAGGHGVRPLVPGVPVADHRHQLRRWAPRRRTRSPRARRRCRGGRRASRGDGNGSPR